jgi:hypothetical protein
MSEHREVDFGSCLYFFLGSVIASLILIAAGVLAIAMKLS